MGAGGCRFFFLSSAFCPWTACHCRVGTAEEVMREAVWAAVQNTSLGTHRFAVESPLCLMTVISISARYLEADMATLLSGILLCHEWRRTRNPAAPKYISHLTALHHRRIFLHFQRPPDLQVSFNLHWQELRRGVSAITSSFGCSPSNSVPIASAGYVGCLLP